MKENEKAGKAEQKKRKDDRWLDLEIWKIANALALQVFKETQAFPQCELYGLTSQLRRAVLSIPTNIVEGCSRKGDRELARFISISVFRPSSLQAFKPSSFPAFRPPRLPASQPPSLPAIA